MVATARRNLLVLVGPLSIITFCVVRSISYQRYVSDPLHNKENVIELLANADKDAVAQTCRDYYDVPIPRRISRQEAVPIDLEDPVGTEVGHLHVRRHLACLLVQPLLLQSGRKSSDISMFSMYWWRLSLRTYFQAYLDVIRRKSLILFQHVSKSGGTTLCENVYLNGCRAPTLPKKGTASDPYQLPEELFPVTGLNCFSNATGDGHMWNVSMLRAPLPDTGDNFTCEWRKDFAQKYDLNFMSNENYITDSLRRSSCRRGILNYHIVREPMERLHSHYWHVLGVKDCMSLPKHCITPEMTQEQFCSAKISVRHKAFNATCFFAEWYGVGNNYYTRSLGGEQAWTRPHNGVTTQDQQEAIANLLMFDVVVLLGSPLQPFVEKALLGFGRTVPYRANVRKYPTDLFTPEFEKELEKSNALDLQLYRVAHAIYVLDVAILKAAEAECNASHEKSTWSPFCEVFRSDPSTTEATPQKAKKKRYMEQRWLFSEQNRTFSCGCGWVGSMDNRTAVKNYLPRLMEVRPYQQCPKRHLYE